MISNLTLTSQQFKLQLKLFSGIVLLISVICFITSSSQDKILIVVWRSFSTAIMFATILFSAFYQWIWRLGPIAQWLGKPVIGGVWIGKIASDYQRTPEQPRMEKPIVFVIRQTFLTLTIQSFTDYQIGVSKVEAILLEPKTNVTRLSYVFELENEYSGPSTVVNGAGILKLLSSDKILKGDYWTNTPTHGTLKLKNISSGSRAISEIKEFKDALKRWPLGPYWDVI